MGALPDPACGGVELGSGTGVGGKDVAKGDGGRGSGAGGGLGGGGDGSDGGGAHRRGIPHPSVIMLATLGSAVEAL